MKNKLNIFTEQREGLGNKTRSFCSQRTHGKFRKINVRIRKINVLYSMREVIFPRLYHVRALLRILAMSLCNINVALTMGLESQLLFRYIGR